MTVQVYPVAVDSVEKQQRAASFTSVVDLSSAGGGGDAAVKVSGKQKRGCCGRIWCGCSLCCW